MRTVADVLKNIATSIPENWNHADALKHAGVGAGIGGILGYLLSEKKNRARNAAIGATAAGLGGLGYYALKQNVMEQTGGLYTGKKKGQKPTLPAVPTGDNTPGQHYVVYMPGAGEDERRIPDSIDANTAVIPYGEVDTAVEFINSLRPQDSVDLVGFSMGGGGALKAAERVKHPIRTMYTLDPVSTDLLQATRTKLFGYKKPAAVLKWKNIRPFNYDAPTVPNKFVRTNPLVLGDIAPDGDNIKVDDDHSMWTTGLRVHEHIPSELRRLRQVLSRLNTTQTARHSS